MEKSVQFLKNAILGKKVGAIARSSKYVIKRVLKSLDGFTPHIIVEYGAGDGVLTLELLKILTPKGKILVVELDPNFIAVLKKIKDPRLVIVKEKMQDVSTNLEKYGFKSPDLIVSSIPFSLINSRDRDGFVKSSHASLSQNGRLIIFHQYSNMMAPLIRKYFNNIKTSFEPRNIFPCFIMFSKKL